MLRRSSVQLLRRTPVCRSGGHELFVRPTLAEIPSADESKGFFSTLNGSKKYFRLIDIKWMMNRAVAMHREYYIATPTMYAFLWMFAWRGSGILFYGDGKPPRKVDWNQDAFGNLPSDFKKAEVRKAKF